MLTKKEKELLFKLVQKVQIEVETVNCPFLSINNGQLTILDVNDNLVIEYQERHDSYSYHEYVLS